MDGILICGGCLTVIVLVLATPIWIHWRERNVRND